MLLYLTDICSKPLSWFDITLFLVIVCNAIHSSANLSGEMNNYSTLLINFQVKN